MSNSRPKKSPRLRRSTSCDQTLPAAKAIARAGVGRDKATDSHQGSHQTTLRRKKRCEPRSSKTAFSLPPILRV